MGDFTTALIMDCGDSRIYLVYDPICKPCFPLNHSEVYMVDVTHFQTAVAILRIQRPEDHCGYGIREAIATLYDIDIKSANAVVSAAVSYLCDPSKYSHSNLGIRL